MRLRLVRHATLLVEIGGRRLLVDPMLSDAGSLPPIEGSTNDRRNPLVELPTSAVEVVAGLDAVLVTHTHTDHLDDAAVEGLPPGLPVLCIAGDTILCDEVIAALERRRPDVVVVNGGAAQFAEGDPITMSAADVIDTAGGPAS